MATLCPLTYSLDNVVAPGAEVWGGADRKGEGGGEGREGGYINMKSLRKNERESDFARVRWVVHQECVQASERTCDSA